MPGFVLRIFLHSSKTIHLGQDNIRNHQVERMDTEETQSHGTIVSYHGLITILFQSILEQAGYSSFSSISSVFHAY